MNRYMRQVCAGIVRQNPTVVLMLGMCPTLAVTTTAVSALGMGLSTMAVLVLSNTLVSLMRNIIPDSVRLPAYIVITSSVVTITGLILQAYFIEMYSMLGVYIPLIVVNCIILGRAETYAAHNPVLLSFMDGLGMGFGFTLGLTVIGIVRELLGQGTIFNIDFNDMLLGGRYTPVSILVMAPGAFFVLACICAIRNRLTVVEDRRGNCCFVACDRCTKKGCGFR